MRSIKTDGRSPCLCARLVAFVPPVCSVRHLVIITSPNEGSILKGHCPGFYRSSGSPIQRVVPIITSAYDKCLTDRMLSPVSAL